MKDAKDFLEQGTSLSGYQALGPYSCEHCQHLKGEVCTHSIVALDPSLTHPSKGTTKVDVEYGCCRYVSQSEKVEDEDDAPEPLRKVLK